MTDEEKIEAARRRRARIRAQINEIQAEIEQLESCKRELHTAKADLAQVEAEINNGMTATENVFANLSAQYPGNRLNNYIAPNCENILSNKGSIQANISGYRNEINNAINDLQDAINQRYSRIRNLQNQL